MSVELRIPHPELLPILREKTNLHGSDTGNRLGTACEHYIADQIDLITPSDMITGVQISKPGSPADHNKIDITVIHPDEQPTFIQVTTVPRRAHKKLRELGKRRKNTVFVIPVLDYQKELIPGQIIQESVRCWYRQGPDAGQRMLWSYLEATKPLPQNSG